APRYLPSRPARAPPGPRGGRAARRGHRSGGGRSGGSRHRLLSRIPAPPRLTGLGRPDAVRSTRTLLTGLGAVSAGVLVSVLIAGGSPSDGSGTDPTGATSAADGRGVVPTESPPGVAGLPTGPEPALLRNIASGLCLDTRGEPQDGTGTRLAGCSSRLSQQWTYEEDGLLRSVADPGLCLDAHKDAGVVVLATCADAGESRADDVRYDLTEQGELLPRWDEQLALVPAAPDANADIVIRVRDRSENQRWLTEPVSSAQDVLSIGRPRTPAAGSVEPAGPVT
ncbi:RICIN domain-containing protein, partial [Streptomyces sp. NPDC007000]|uniref:RICIN domain-containing protein n=1 Tax=Streptomyces sp. NPDC007000 TaxID=3155357 RepID=UPI0033DBD238